MNGLKDIFVTEINPPRIVHSKKGDFLEITNRACYELSVCITGRIIYTKDEKQYISKANTATILPRGASYTLSVEKESLFHVITFQCENYTDNDIIVIDLLNYKTCIQKIGSLQKMFEHNRTHFKVLSVFYDVLNAICEGAISNYNLFQAAIKYMDENLSNPNLSNESIANHFSISEVYLRKIFNQYCNISPRQYLLDQRIQNAMYLLKNTKISIIAVSKKCGFTNSNHFCRTFKQRTGMTPTEFSSRIDFFERKSNG